MLLVPRAETRDAANKQGNSYDKEYLAQHVDSAQVKNIC